jgi:uncharacterized protein YjiS (DUF1127 family)
MVCSCARQVGDRGDLYELGGSARRAGRRGKYPSSANGLWEHLMLNSSGSLNGVARRYGVPSRELRVALRDNSSTPHENGAWAPRLDLADVKSPPVIMPTMTRAEGQKTAPWSSLFTSFIEGFALYGASYGCYGALLNAIATSSVESCPTEASAPQPEGISLCERREFISLVSPAASPGATAPKRETSHNWLARPWRAITSRWAHWRRQREIKKAVAALTKLDDGTLRDIGIPHRSQIEQVVRYCRDC